MAGAHCVGDPVRRSFPTIFVEPVLIPAQAINKDAPTSGASLFMAEAGICDLPSLAGAHCAS